MNVSKKRIAVIFVAGALTGAGIALLVSPGQKAAANSAGSMAETAEQEAKPEKQFVIEPMFADSMEACQWYYSYYHSLLSSGKLWHTGDMSTLASTCAFFGEVELYLLVNAHLKSLPDEQKGAFVEHYNKWLAGYNHEIKQPFYEEDGVTPVEGTMVIPLYPNRRSDLIQDFLKTMPNRVEIPKHKLCTKKDFEYVGE